MLATTVNDNTNSKITNKISLQALTYQTIKERFSLVSNMAVRACARVASNRKTAKLKGKLVKRFVPTSMDCNKDLFTFREKDWQVSLATVQSRERIAMNAGNYQRDKLKGAKPTSAQLCKHRDGLFYLHIQLKDDVPEPTKSSKVIGVDFGRRDIAVTSDGEKWDGQDIQQIRDRYSRVRASLQKRAAKGTRSTRHKQIRAKSSIHTRLGLDRVVY